MSGLLIPILLALLAVGISINAYRGIRRGSTRFYTLEREAMLRRASFTLLAGVLLFMIAIALLVYTYQTAQPGAESPDAGLSSGDPTATPTLFVEIFPPTATATATPDPNQPTPTPTPVVRRGVIEGTGGSGAYLRAGPGVGSETLLILDDGSFVTLLDDEPPIDVDGYTWIKVRTAGGEEGWIADLFLTVRDR